MKPILLLTVGLSGSGKTSWSTEFTRNREDWVDLNRDDIRFALFTKGVRDFSQYKFSKDDEKRVTEVIEERAKWARYNKKSILISDTNLNPKTRAKWLQWAKENDYHYLIKEFPITFDEARKRDVKREGGVGIEVLWKQWMSWLEYVNYDFYVPDTTKSKAILIDIDGTVAQMNGRKPYEWDKVGEDLPRQAPICLVQGMIEQGVTPIFLSGRDGICKDLTYKWILDNIMEWYLPENGGFHLFMRTAGDSRKDSVVKKELFDSYVRKNFNVVGAIDDRKSILELWTQMKIPNIINVGGLYERF